MKKPVLLTCLLLALVIILQAQTETTTQSSVKSGQAAIRNPVMSGHETPNPAKATHAVVVGISDYQDPGIPDLRFAHRDAEIFAKWLQSPAGGSIPADNITLLINESATYTAITVALYNLLDVSKSGDRVIFYFSGHGDVETKIARQPGYLLGHDSPSCVYAAGAVDLRHVQDVVTTLSDNQVQVLLVTDACHAGKLAGESVGGAQSTALALQKQFAGEVKIMSCQPDEYSLEGEQWGGGRGVFSFHLLDGLTGLADRNDDGIVSLFEIGRYLEDRVTTDAAPHPQMPLTVGDRNALLAAVDDASLQALQSAKANEQTVIARTDGRGIEEDVLARVDKATRQRYVDFKRALERTDLLTEADSSANVLFGHLIAVEELKPLHGIMRRNFAVALLDDVQQAINALLASDPYETNNWRYNPSKYGLYPQYLERALELLGPEHHMADAIQVKKYYFEAYLLSRSPSAEMDMDQRNAAISKAKELLQKATLLDPDAPYLWHAFVPLFLLQYQQDSVEFYTQKAMALAPAWLLPYVDLSQDLMWTQAKPELALDWLLKGLAIDSNSYVLLERLAWAYQSLYRHPEAISVCERMIDLRPDIGNGFATLGFSHITMQEYEKAGPYVQKGMELNPDALWWSGTDYGRVLNRTRRFREAEAHLFRLMDLESAQLFEKGLLAEELITGYLDQGRLEEAEQLLGKLWLLNVNEPSNVCARTQLGYIRLLQGRLTESWKLLEEALELDPTYNALDDRIHACMALVLEQQGKVAEAEQHWSSVSGKYIRNQTYPFYDDAMFQKGRYLLRHNRDDEAAGIFQTLIAESPAGYRGWYGMALWYARKGDKAAALDYLEKALDRWYPIPGPILEEPLFGKIRKTKRFKALMTKHYPDWQ